MKQCKKRAHLIFQIFPFPVLNFLKTAVLTAMPLIVRSVNTILHINRAKFDTSMKLSRHM